MERSFTHKQLNGTVIMFIGLREASEFITSSATSTHLLSMFFQRGSTCDDVEAKKRKQGLQKVLNRLKILSVYLEERVC